MSSVQHLVCVFDDCIMERGEGYPFTVRSALAGPRQEVLGQISIYLTRPAPSHVSKQSATRFSVLSASCNAALARSPAGCNLAVGVLLRLVLFKPVNLMHPCSLVRVSLSQVCFQYNGITRPYYYRNPRLSRLCRPLITRQDS